MLHGKPRIIKHICKKCWKFYTVILRKSSFQFSVRYLWSNKGSIVVELCICCLINWINLKSLCVDLICLLVLAFGERLVSFLFFRLQPFGFLNKTTTRNNAWLNKPVKVQFLEILSCDISEEAKHKSWASNELITVKLPPWKDDKALSGPILSNGGLTVQILIMWWQFMSSYEIIINEEVNQQGLTL